MKRYGYVRVSTKEQNPERQVIALREYSIPAENIYLDQMSGKDFLRPQYHDLLRAIFPNKSYLTAGYPELIEYPWLLPVCWVKRWMRHLKIGTQNKGNLVKESVEISSRKISLLKKYGIL